MILDGAVCSSIVGGEIMARLVAFNNITLDGYFAGKNGDFSWAKGYVDPEFHAFIADNAKSGGMLLFGRITYQLMASYWPTPHARESEPVVAGRMNDLPKVVFSRTLDAAPWNNTRLVKGDMVQEVRKLKKEFAEDITILGSGSIILQLAQEGLIDEYQIVVNPIVLGGGRTMFEGIKGIKGTVSLKLTKTRSFGNGNVFLSYEVVA